MQELFLGERHISTKVQDAPPVKYFPGCQVRNSIIATGCMIRGAVENSIIFRGCTVEEGAVVRNSIIMPNDVITKGAQLENVICDKCFFPPRNSFLFPQRGGVGGCCLGWLLVNLGGGHYPRPACAKKVGQEERYVSQKTKSAVCHI